MATNKTEYIGDGVYVTIEHGSIVLKTEDPQEPENIIYLEPSVLISLVEYAQRVGLLVAPQKK